ncbi:MAG: hypothetical protein COB23_00615 [Methylophaga sp.]|nr:MAG: hypothetical protein COB23_00615 [Methylophaga sp.]
MKTIKLSTIFLLLNSFFITAHAYETVERSFAEQLEEQKTQLRPQEFNFFSDRYKQVKAHEKIMDSKPAMVKGDKISFKMQLDSQTQLLTDHNLYPVVSIQSSQPFTN